jgi:hypothetical protein
MLTTPSGKPGFLNQLAQFHRADGRLLGGLEDDGVAGGERGRELPGGHQQREVPGDDLAADADGLAQGVVEHLAGDGDGLALNLRRPAREVLKVLDDLRQINVLDSVMGLPLSAVSSAASSPECSSMSCASLYIMRPRSRALTFDHLPSKARRAATTALSMSALSASATSASVAPVAGFGVVKVLPDSASTHCRQ